MEHFDVGGQMPAEYLDLYLWRDVYHCDPETVDKHRLLAHLTVLAAESKFKAAQNG